jgi:hypothetical protein
LKKQIAGALVASLLIGSAPVWAEGETTTKPEATQRQQLRDSIDRAVEDQAAGPSSVVATEPKSSGPELTTVERRDLDTRRAALRTDPVARGTGGIVMLVLGTALTIGATAWAINKSKQDTTTVSMGRR